MQRHRKRSDLWLGKSAGADGRKVWLKERDRSTHLQLIGATGTGKSKMLEWMIREDILNRQGLCLIDPHASLYHNLVQWLAWSRLDRKVILFDPGEEGWVLSFNPLHARDGDIAFQMDSMVRACAKVWSDADMAQTPLLQRNLRNIFYVLAEKGLTLVEALHLISESNPQLRRQLTESIADEVIREQWRIYNAMSPREFRETFASTHNRLVEFLSAPRMRRIFGQNTQTIDFRKLMDEGYIILVNLSWGQRVSPQNARMLGTLLINDMFTAARNRPEGSRPFYLYIDEFAEFANEDTAQILDQCRKWGLHLVMAHQHLQQLRTVSEKVYFSVLTNAKSKLVFGGLATEDAEVLARQMFMGEFNIDEIKHVLKSRKVMDYHLEWLTVHGYSRSMGQHWSEADGWSTMESSGSGQGMSETIIQPPNGADPTTSTGLSSHTMMGSSHGMSGSSSYGGSEIETYSESNVPLLMPIMGEEVSSIQFRSLDEQLYRAMSLMVNQPTRYGLLKMPGQKVLAIQSPLVKPTPASQDRVATFRERCFSVTDVIKPLERAEAEITERQTQLRQVTKISDDEPLPKGSPPPKLPL